jgi:WD40 repeat protein
MLMGLPDKWNTCSRTIPIEGEPSTFAYWEDSIAIGLESNRMVLLDAITGTKKSVLSGHEDSVLSLVFSRNGSMLVSGSEDKTVKLWDVQTGGVIKTFGDNPSAILAVSISPDGTTIAGGTQDGAVRLWDIRTGKSHPVVGNHGDLVTAISFSPTNPRRLASSSMDGTVQQWDLDGRQTGIPYREASSVFHVAYTPDGSRFASCGGTVVTVRDSESEELVVKIGAPTRRAILKYGCFSLDGRFLACAAADTIYVWDIAKPEARLVGDLTGHSKSIISIAFSSSLISLSLDRSVKFWQSSSFLTDSITTGDTAQIDSALIESVHLFIKDGMAVTSDSSGGVKTWTLATGTRKSSFSTLAKGVRDVHLAGEGETLVVVWRAQDGEEYYVWDVMKREFRRLDSSLHKLLDLKISGDGTKIFGLDNKHVEARCLRTGEEAGLVEHQSADPWRDALAVRGSKVWLENSKDVGWDFGGPGVSTFPLSREFPERPRLDIIESTRAGADKAWVQDTATGRPVFHIPERYIKTGMRRQWDGQHLVYWSPSGEVVVMDFGSVCSQ